MSDRMGARASVTLGSKESHVFSRTTLDMTRLESRAIWSVALFGCHMRCFGKRATGDVP